MQQIRLKGKMIVVSSSSVVIVVVVVMILWAIGVSPCKSKSGDSPGGLTMSVPRSMQRMVTVPSGRGMSQRMKAKKGEISGMFEVRV